MGRNVVRTVLCCVGYYQNCVQLCALALLLLVIVCRVTADAEKQRMLVRSSTQQFSRSTDDEIAQAQLHKELIEMTLKALDQKIESFTDLWNQAREDKAQSMKEREEMAKVSRELKATVQQFASFTDRWNQAREEDKEEMAKVSRELEAAVSNLTDKVQSHYTGLESQLQQTRELYQVAIELLQNDAKERALLPTVCDTDVDEKSSGLECQATQPQDDEQLLQQSYPEVDLHSKNDDANIGMMRYVEMVADY